MRTAASVDDIRQMLHSTSGFASASDGRVVAVGVTDVTVRSESPIGRASIHDEFGFEPDIRVVFRLDKFDDWERGVLMALGACASLIRTSRADAVLLEDGEQPLLTARAGALHLDETRDFWTADRRLAVGFPEER